MSKDTISDMLTRIRNASLAKHQIVHITATKVTRNIAILLVREGFIEGFEELKNEFSGSLLLSLKYNGKDRTPVIKKIVRISRPGLRLYNKAKNIPRILGGFGISIISTSKGLMTDQKAREEGIGGEILCYIW